jgi:hypothetical protein
VGMLTFGQVARMRGRADGTLSDHRAWGTLLLTNSFPTETESIPKSAFFVNAAVVRCNKKPDLIQRAGLLSAWGAEPGAYW